MKVMGAGFGRTGTASLQSALEELGFGPRYHMIEVFENPHHTDFWEAAWRGEPVDWPACTFYKGPLPLRLPSASGRPSRRSRKTTVNSNRRKKL